MKSHTHFHDLTIPMLMMVSLTITSRSGCQPAPNMSIDSAHMAATSPEAKDATQAQPVIVTRDNPNLGGAVEIASSDVTSLAAAPFNADGRWANFSGLARLREVRTNGSVHGTQTGPLLPRNGDWKSPGAMWWNTRFGGLIHENVYEGRIEAKHGAAQTSVASNRGLWMKLSPDTLLVPVVVINWRIGGRQFSDMTETARAAFDFIGYDAPPMMSSPLTAAQLARPNQPSIHVISPSLAYVPPDDIFHQCNVQLQMIASFTLDLPVGHVSNCTQGSPKFLPLDELESMLAAAIGNPARFSQLRALKPLYVGFGDFGTCRQQNMQGQAMTEADTAVVEIDYVPGKTLLAHELGHALGLFHYEGQYNVMNAFAGPEDVVLSNTTFPGGMVSQCATVRLRAAGHSRRYQDFNAGTGRTHRPPTVVIPPVTTVCCEVNGRRYESTNYTCSGSVVPLTMCNVCCAEGTTASLELPSQCSGTQQRPSECIAVCCSNPSKVTSAYECSASGGSELAPSLCESVCCSTSNGEQITTYQCQQSGGVPVECPVEYPH